MEEFRNSIVCAVRSFLDNIIEGNIDVNILAIYDIPIQYIEICRDENHPSCKKLKARLFYHIMERIGFYEHRHDEKWLEFTATNISSFLLNPSTSNQKSHKILFLPCIHGIKHCLERIEKLWNANDVEFKDKESCQEIKFTKEERCFRLSFKRNMQKNDRENNLNEYFHDIEIDGENFVVSKDGVHLSSRKITFTHPDEISIDFNKFRNSELDEDSNYFFRYITEIKREDNIQGLFAYSCHDIDGHDTATIQTLVKGNRLLIYNSKHNGRHFLIMEYDAPLRASEMMDLCFSSLLAFGMITTNIHLNDCWLAAYANSNMSEECGFFYQSLVPSFNCVYPIFTTNAFSILVPIAKKIDPVNGEHRGCQIITHFKCSNKLNNFPTDVLGKIIENLLNYEDLQRGLFIILEGSKYTLEVQAAVYCVAIEAISNLSSIIIGETKETIVENGAKWKIVSKRLKATLNSLFEENIISKEENEGLDKKIDNINKNFNSEKLKALLEFYHYPLDSFDFLTLKLRNPLLHGSIHFKILKENSAEDNLWELSMNLHKLCCSVVLLMAGYKGYIVNNRKYYGYPKSGKPFIKIG